jgi:hypothetical protein
MAESDPGLPIQAANYCIARGSFALMLVALLIGHHFSILGPLQRASASLSCRLAFNLHSARSHEFQEARANAKQRSLFAVSFWRARRHYVSQSRERSQGILRIVVVPGHAVVIEECEQFISVLFNALFESRPSLRCAFHGNDEPCSRFPVPVEISSLQATRIYSLDDLAEQSPNRPRSPSIRH